MWVIQMQQMWLKITQKKKILGEFFSLSFNVGSKMFHLTFKVSSKALVRLKLSL